MGVFNDIANGMRDGLLSRDELNKRKEATEFCTVAKVVCVAAAILVVTGAVFSILSGTFAGVVLGVAIGAGGLIVAHDSYKFIDNIQQMYDSAITEIFSRLTKDTLKTQLSKGMIIGRPFVDNWIDSLQKERSSY